MKPVGEIFIVSVDASDDDETVICIGREIAKCLQPSGISIEKVLVGDEAEEFYDKYLCGEPSISKEATDDAPRLVKSFDDLKWKHSGVQHDYHNPNAAQ